MEFFWWIESKTGLLPANKYHLIFINYENVTYEFTGD